VAALDAANAAPNIANKSRRVIILGSFILTITGTKTRGFIQRRPDRLFNC